MMPCSRFSIRWTKLSMITSTSQERAPKAAVVSVAEAVAVIDMSLLKNKLSIAAITLVATGHAVAESGWKTDASFLSYSESQERVNVSKAIWDLTRLGDDGATTVQVVYDTMSGASPTGAIAGSEGSTTFTRASGGAGSSSETSSERPAAQFSDTRRQFSFDQDRQWGRYHTLSYGAVYSTESDYESMGGSIGLKRESTSKNTAIDIGLAATFDSISRSYAVGTPGPLTNVNDTRNFSDGERNTTDLAFGLTQVVNQQTLAQFTLSFSQSLGYHTDPYKVISAADSEDRVLETYTERRPESRFRTSAYAKLIHQLRNTKHAFHLGYRLYSDDWGIQSNTLDALYHHQLTPTQYIEPYVRFYQQSAADFYQRKLDIDDTQSVVLPSNGFASADYRLDDMHSVTTGVKYGLRLTPDTKFRIRIAYLQQRYTTAAFLKNNALILQTSVSYQF